jgi:hypothetical protein
MLKALVLKAWPDPSRLNNHLKTLFSADQVRRWLRQGERNDVLSGMKFSELALREVDKKEFSRYYASLFSDPQLLTLMVEPRKTLHTFLDHIRLIRNTLVAGQSLTPAQIVLVDSYYAQIAGPVQRAFEQGRTRINPAELLAVDTSELHRFWEQAQQKNKATDGDIFEIRENIDKPQRRAERTPEQRDQLISVLLWGAVGVMVLAMLAGGVWLFVDDTQPRAAEVAVVQTQKPEVMRDTPTSRETLTRMGITWDENNFRSGRSPRGLRSLRSPRRSKRSSRSRNSRLGRIGASGGTIRVRS